jgi:hypothetical protein
LRPMSCVALARRMHAPGRRIHMPHDHICDRAGVPSKVIDDSDHTICIYPTCSKCGSPQVFGPDAGPARKRSADRA